MGDSAKLLTATGLMSLSFGLVSVMFLLACTLNALSEEPSSKKVLNVCRTRFGLLAIYQCLFSDTDGSDRRRVPSKRVNNQAVRS